MKTKLSRSLILTCLLSAALPAAVQAQFNYTTTNGAITITGYTGSGGAVIIPATINGLPVTSIGDEAFNGGYLMTSVTIPNSVTNIGQAAFNYCSSLTVIAVDTNNLVYSSVNGVLCDKNQTTLVEFPGGRGGSYTIPDSITNIGDYAFKEVALTNVTIPDSITSIGYLAFEGYSSLTVIKVSSNNLFYSSVNGVLFDKSQTTLIQYPGGLGGSYTVPNSVTSIEDWSFAGCFTLTNVTIGNGVTSIGSHAFDSCYGLTSVAIGNSVTNIGDWAFAGCNSLTNATIPDSVTSIEDWAFAGCYTLTNVTIGNGVTSMGSHAFDSCWGLIGVAIGNRVTSIGDYAFYNCVRLSSVTMPASVTNIGSHAFDSCWGLIGVAIGNRVTSIGDYAFYHCYSLASITIPDSVNNIGWGAFEECYDLTNVMMGDSIANIGWGAFKECRNLTSIVIPDSVTNIGGGAFEQCNRLTGVYFRGNAPVADYTVFDDYSDFGDYYTATAYYLSGATGWNDFSINSYIPAVPWNPLIQTGDASFGVRTNQFGFNIAWVGGRIVVVEASTNLSDWTPIATKTLTGDTFYFNDLEWGNYPSRFYQLLDFLAPPPGSGGITGFDFYLDVCRSPNSDFNSKIEAFHMIVTFVISNEIRDPISLSFASEAASIARSLDPNDPDLNILTAYIGGVRGP